jgi:peroxiredoxin
MFMRFIPVLALLLLYSGCNRAPRPASDAAKAIAEQTKKLRSLPDDTRATVTRQLALQIRQLPQPMQLGLALPLANLSTEGDFGRDTLQAVTTTLEQALSKSAVPAKDGAYAELAELARYEHMQVTLSDPRYTAALANIEADDRVRREAEFTLADLNGKRWSLKDLRGNVVLVNFWATWCPPCRKEMPDLDVLYQQFKSEGLVILAISDEEAAIVKAFIAQQQKVSYPVLLDPGRRVNGLFRVEGIPKTFVYDRSGKLAAQSIDMRTRQQFLEMLAQAGLRKRSKRS